MYSKESYQLREKISIAFGNLLSRSAFGLEHYAGRKDLFDEYSIVLEAATQCLEEHEAVQCEFTIEGMEMFDEDYAFFNNACDGKIVESDTRLAYDVALLFKPTDGVYISTNVRFADIGVGGPSTSYYVAIDGDCIEFEDYAKPFVQEAIENNEGPYTDDYDYDEERYRIQDQIFNNMEKTSVDDFDDIAFSEELLIDFTE